MMPAPPVSVIILSGGESKRFGGAPKALCRTGGRTFLERIISSVSGFREFPVPEIVIVGGKHYRDIKAFIGKLSSKGIKVIHNRAWKKGQFSSLRKGIESLSGRAGPVLIWPCDIPFVRKSTVKKLLLSLFSVCHSRTTVSGIYDEKQSSGNRFRVKSRLFGIPDSKSGPGMTGKGKSIFIPSFNMRAGHPVLIGKGFIPVILKEPSTCRLDLCLKKNRKKIEYVPVIDRNILRDIDTKDALKGI